MAPSPPIRTALKVWIALTLPGAPMAGQTLNLASTIARPLRYRPAGADFVVENGPEYFNRPLYTNTAFRVDGGDRPEFSLYLPGRGGVLRVGALTPAGDFWLDEARRVTARYRPGSLLYDVADPRLGGATIRLAALMLPEAAGFIVRAEIEGGPPAELFWAYGGANGDRGRRGGDIGAEREPVSRFFRFRPEFCRGNTVAADRNRFELRGRAGGIRGVASPGARVRIGDANRWTSAADLASGDASPQAPPVALAFARLAPGGAPSYLALEPERPPAGTPSRPLPSLFAEAEARRRSIAGKVAVDTPDPFVNAAAAALCVAADGIWDEPSGTVQHGAVAWRVKLPGWRGPYANDDLGWHDRARRHFEYWAARQTKEPVPASVPPPGAAFRRSRDEAALHGDGDLAHSHYDMNLVWADGVFRHLLWTGDLAFARRMWPALERHLAWERRLFRRPFGPDRLPLYEGYACIWASDDLEYEGGGAAHASAYNYYENSMAARVARLVGADPAPYEREAGLIRRAMRRELWLADRGWFGEFKDLLGRRAVHPSPALWTFYTTVDSGAATPLEAWQMTRFIDTRIAHIPIVGAGVPADGAFVLPTTDWMPYTWSTNNVAMAEVEHTALGYWQAGRPREAFRMFKGAILASMYLGLCPGNAGMTTTFDMARGESQRDFGDAVGTTARALVEGLFGVAPDALAGFLRIRPGFPEGWDRATLRHPDVDFAFRRTGLRDAYDVEPTFGRPMALRLELAARRDAVADVRVNGRPAAWRPVPEAVGGPRIEIDAPASPAFRIEVAWTGTDPVAPSAPPVAALGRPFRARTGAARLLSVEDPETALADTVPSPEGFIGVASGRPGSRTVFARLRQGRMTWRAPIGFDLRPAFEILPAERQGAAGLRFAVCNNTAASVDCDASIRAGGRAAMERTSLPAFGASEPVPFWSPGLLPGTNPVTVDLGADGEVEGTVVDWRLPVRPGTRFDPVSLDAVFNDRVDRLFRHAYLAPRSPFCSLAMPTQGIGTWCRYDATADIDDSGLREASARDGGRIPGPGGVPFATPGPGNAPNVVFTSQWDNFPRERTVPLSGRARHLYLLMAGSTNPMQSRIDNGEVIVTYRDGTTARLALENPLNWWPIDEDPWIDDYAFRRPEPIPPRIDLRTGRVRILDPAAFAGKGGPIPGGAATVLDLPLDPARELRSLTVRALADEVVVGLMAATLAR